MNTKTFTVNGLRRAIEVGEVKWWLLEVPMPAEVAAHNDELNAILDRINALNLKMKPLGIGVCLASRTQG